jgi:hypothetical protein
LRVISCQENVLIDDIHAHSLLNDKNIVKGYNDTIYFERPYLATKPNFCRIENKLNYVITLFQTVKEYFIHIFIILDIS